MSQLTTARAKNEVPPQAAARMDRKTLASVANEAQGPLKLFLVEDSKIYRERLAEHLAVTCGAQLVGWADSEQEAIEELRKGGWDVLVCDLQLKQGTGLGVLQSLQPARRPPGSMVVMMTDHDFYLYRRKATELGADLFCVKGRDLDQLVKTLREFAGQRSARDPN